MPPTRHCAHGDDAHREGVAGLLAHGSAALKVDDRRPTSTAVAAPSGALRRRRGLSVAHESAPLVEKASASARLPLMPRNTRSERSLRSRAPCGRTGPSPRSPLWAQVKLRTQLRRPARAASAFPIDHLDPTAIVASWARLWWAARGSHQGVDAPGRLCRDQKVEYYSGTPIFAGPSSLDPGLISRRQIRRCRQMSHKKTPSDLGGRERRAHLCRWGRADGEHTGLGPHGKQGRSAPF